MSFIQVPIGKGITKFPQFKRSIPEFTKESIQKPIAQSNLQFLHDITRDQKFIQLEGTLNLNITPASGSTFYYLGAMIQNTHATDAGTVRLIIDLGSTGTINTIFETIELAANESYQFKLPSARLSGTGNDLFGLQIEVNPAAGAMQGALWGYNENTEKP